MDRNNSLESKQIDPSVVALRKESVDRNNGVPYSAAIRLVALRKESVDRNTFRQCGVVTGRLVALRKESVDRNVFLTLTVRNVPSRSPQGERG